MTKDERKARVRARRQALMILYQSELAGNSVQSILEDRSYCTSEPDPALEGDDELVDDIPLEPYAREVALGVEADIDEIDALLEAMSANWKLWRMPVVDLNILRIAVFEMRHCDDVPVPVAINEAVEQARCYAGDDSTKFINGVLGAIAARMEEEGAYERFDPSKLPMDEPIDGAVLDAAGAVEAASGDED